MSRKSEGVAIGLLFGVSLVVLVLVGILAAQELGLLEWPVTREHREQGAIEYSGRDDETADRTAGRDTSSKRLSQESEKDKLNLYAQEGMWRAANYMV